MMIFKYSYAVISNVQLTSTRKHKIIGRARMTLSYNYSFSFESEKKLKTLKYTNRTSDRPITWDDVLTSYSPLILPHGDNHSLHPVRVGSKSFDVTQGQQSLKGIACS